MEEFLQCTCRFIHQKILSYVTMKKRPQKDTQMYKKKNIDHTGMRYVCEPITQAKRKKTVGKK